VYRELNVKRPVYLKKEIRALQDHTKSDEISNYWVFSILYNT